jgi:hypothetical protein
MGIFYGIPMGNNPMVGIFPMGNNPMVSNFYRETHGNFFMGFPWEIIPWWEYFPWAIVLWCPISSGKPMVNPHELPKDKNDKNEKALIKRCCNKTIQ